MQLLLLLLKCILFFSLTHHAKSSSTCNASEAWDLSTTSCIGCTDGKYQDENNVATSCKTCAAGKKFNTKALACIDCLNGKYQEQNTLATAVCKTCAAGLYTVSSSVVCKACETGKFQELAESIEYTCKFCAAGKGFTSKVAACEECIVGKYQHEHATASSVDCSFCSAGKQYANITTACSVCTFGTYHHLNNELSSVCKTCNVGQFSLTEVVECSDCEAGMYQELIASIEYVCKHCPAGFAFENTSTGCLTCATGKYQHENAAPSVDCSFCLAGREFVNITHDCTFCASGRYQDENIVASVFCKNCAAGQMFATLSTACTICMAGKFQDQFNAASVECQDCPAGRYLTDIATARKEHDTESDCLYCPAGKQFNVSTSNCTTCTVGKYQHENAAPSVDCSFCPAGFEFQSIATPCTNCATGKYQDETSAPSVNCSFCAAGKDFVDTATACETCATGKYQHENAAPSVDCSFCVAGKEFDAAAVPAGSLECKTCDAGKYQHENAAPSVDCLFCSAGKEYVNIANACDLCIMGKYHDRNNEWAICKTCGKAQAAPDGKNGCEECLVGKFQERKTSLVYTCKFCQAGREFVAKDENCTVCPDGKYQAENANVSVLCKFCTFGQEFKSTDTKCTECQPGRYQNDSQKINVKCKFCQEGRYLDKRGGVMESVNTGDGIIGCLPCRRNIELKVFEYSPCPGAEKCDNCPPGQISNQKDRDRCEIGSMKSKMPDVQLVVDPNTNTLCYVINVTLEGFEDSSIVLATGARITYGRRRTELSDPRTSIDIHFDPPTTPSKESDVEACFDWNEDNQCIDLRTFSNSPGTFKKTDAKMNMTVVSNDPTSPNKATMVCIRPDFDLQRQTFFSKVDGLFDGTIGDTSSPSFQWRDTSDCGPSQYLDNTHSNPLKWQCLGCPKGAGCHGDVVWTDVQAQLGYYRLRREDCACCGTPPTEKHSRGVFYNEPMATKANCLERFETTVPDQFEKCVYPTGCLGSPNKELAGQYFIEHDTRGPNATLTVQQALDRRLMSDPPNPKQDQCRKSSKGVGPAAYTVIYCDVARDKTLPEQCNDREGFANNCSRGGQRTECRLCRTCLTGYFGDGFSTCQTCPPIESTFGLSILAVLLMFFMLYLFVKTALEEAEQLSSDDSNFSHLAQSMQKILINHAQLVSIAGTFPLKWPPSIRMIFQVSKMIGEPTESAANPQCYASVFPNQVQGTASSSFFPKQLFLLSMPILVTVLTSIYFWFSYLCHKYKSRRNHVHAKNKHSKTTKTNSSGGAVHPEIGAETKTKAGKIADIVVSQKDKDQDKDPEKDKKTKSSRTVLREIFNEADTKTLGSLTIKQFTNAVLKHGSELGHLWTPKDIRDSFRAAKSESLSVFSKSKRSLSNHGRINFNGFVAVVVKHMDASKKRQRRLSQARGIDLRLLHLKSQAARVGQNYDKITHRDKWVATVVAFYYLMYPVLTKATFAIIGCHYVGEKSYVQMDMQVPCWDPEDREHLDWVFLLFVPSLLLYVIGLPSMGIYFLFQVREVLDHDKHAKFRYSVLLVGYRPSTYYWEGVIAIRKALVIGTSVFLVQAGPRWQTLVAQALNAILLIVHTQFRPFVRVNKNHNTLHNADFFALATSFLTLTAGIYLFQTVGANTGFQIFLQIVVVGANVLFMVMAIFWYMTLRLFDMGSALSESTENKEFKARFVLCLQRILPDWREQSIRDELTEAVKIEHQAMGRADLLQMLKAKKVAKLWIQKTKLKKIQNEATAIEDQWTGDQKMKTKKMDLLKAKAKSRLEERKLNRVRTKAAGSAAGSTPKPKRLKSALPAPLTAAEHPNVGGEKLPTPTPPPPPKPPPKPTRLNSRLPSPLTPEFKTARSTGNLVGTPKFETKSGRKKKKQKIKKMEIVPYEITHGMKLSKLNFRLREKKKAEGFCWVSNCHDIAGVSDNDWLVEVNHQSTKGMGVKEIIDLLRKTSKPFTLGFYRNKRKKN